MIGRSRRVTCASGEAVGVLRDEDTPPAVIRGRRREVLRSLESRSTVPAVGGERLVGELANDVPAFPYGERPAVLDLGRNRAMAILARLRGVDDRRDRLGHRG